MPNRPDEDDEIRELERRIESPAMLKILGYLEVNDFLLNGPDVDQQTLDFLQKLAALGLVEPGYSDPTNRTPHQWIITQKGTRLLRFCSISRDAEGDDAAPRDDGVWLP